MNNFVAFSGMVKEASEQLHLEYYDMVRRFKLEYLELKFSWVPWIEKLLAYCCSNSSYFVGKKVFLQKKYQGARETLQSADCDMIIRTPAFVGDNNENVVRYSKGEHICRAGDPGDTIYILLKGAIGVYVNQMCVAELTTEGTILGEVAAMLTYYRPDQKNDRTASLIANTSSRIIEIKSNQIDEMLTRQPKTLLHLIRTLCEKLTCSNECLKNVSEKIGQMIQLISDLDNDLGLEYHVLNIPEMVEKNDPAQRYVKSVLDKTDKLKKQIITELISIKSELSLLISNDNYLKNSQV